MVQIHVQVEGRLSVAEGHRIAKAVETCLLRDVEDVVDVIVHVDPSSEDDGSPPHG